MGATAALSTFAAGVRYEDLPVRVVEDTKRIIADTLACAVGGTLLDAGRMVGEAASQIGGGPKEATVLGSGRKVSAAAAAFANSALANALDADETLFNSSHHACCTVPSALALAEALGLSGKELITAVAVGYEIGARVCVSLTIARVNEKGDIERFPTTGLGWAVFAAAAAASKALGLAPAQFATALGIAGWTSPISSHLKWDHSGELHMMKNSPHAFMGFSGVTAARLSALGFTGEPAMLDGDAGFWRLVGSPDCDWNVLCGGLGENWWISRAAIKPYATNRLTHHAISLFRALQSENDLGPNEIEKIEIKSFARVASAFLSGNLAPKNPVEAQFSLPFAIAASAYGHELGPQWCQPAQLSDPRLRAFAGRVSVSTDPEIQKTMAEDLLRTRRYPRVPTMVTIFARGQSFTRSANYAPGDPDTEATRLTDADLERKFHLFTDNVLGEELSASAWLKLSMLEQWPEVSVVTAALSARSGD
ncbi:MmgE/PrpD family protein [Aquabacter sp. CN5-332]